MNTVFIHPTEKIAAVGGRQSAEKTYIRIEYFGRQFGIKRICGTFFRLVCQPVKLCPHCNVTAFYITERTYSFSAFGRQRCGFSVIYDIFES